MQMLHGQPTPTTPHLTNQSHRATTRSGIDLSGDDLDHRVGWDVRLEPVEETIP